MSSTLKIVRRNANIQKDFFSMAEYLVWGVNQWIENDYYKKRRNSTRKRVVAFYS
jgi:hypothetical protein